MPLLEAAGGQRMVRCIGFVEENEQNREKEAA